MIILVVSPGCRFEEIRSLTTSSHSNDYNDRTAILTTAKNTSCSSLWWYPVGCLNGCLVDMHCNNCDKPYSLNIHVIAGQLILLGSAGHRIQQSSLHGMIGIINHRSIKTEYLNSTMVTYCNHGNHHAISLINHRLTNTAYGWLPRWSPGCNLLGSCVQRRGLHHQFPLPQAGRRCWTPFTRSGPLTDNG